MTGGCIPVEAIVEGARVGPLKAVAVGLHASRGGPLFVIIHIKHGVIEAACLAHHRDGAVPAQPRQASVFTSLCFAFAFAQESTCLVLYLLPFYLIYSRALTITTK